MGRNIEKDVTIIENPLIGFLIGILVLIGLFLIMSAFDMLIKSTENIWDDLGWAIIQFIFGKVKVISIHIPAAGGFGIGISFGGSVCLGKRNSQKRKRRRRRNMRGQYK